jgi:hypothetical protein
MLCQLLAAPADRLNMPMELQPADKKMLTILYISGYAAIFTNNLLHVCLV